MNSYPPELLVQLAPVMFVGGLDPPQPPGEGHDPFAVLSYRLREALLNQRKVAIWQPERNKTFQVLIADKDVRFPPRKLVPPDDPQYSNAHSPLSPLTPTSPLYPDGLIAPIWVRKHTTLVPSVFVMFMHIFEPSQNAPHSPLDPGDRDREREAEERVRDNELCADIAQRKKSTSERGVKLTVVLLASRRMLDNPSLDGRLTYIRRQSGLDPRAALFVLSPVSQSEIGDFVRSLQEALYEPALEYYTNHSKRVRRKRNRHSQAGTSYVVPSLAGSKSAARPLRPEGWTVRYEYKMACFAEFRGEDEVALKHYQDAYSTLLLMFGSTAILPPRTKRWAEAKVLSDCIDLKICKLYLYNNEHALALAQHTSHMRKFADFSRGWGIGEETYEFWSWLARQHRAFAELLEQGTRSTLKIPTHFRTSPPAAAAAALAAEALDANQRSVLEVEAMQVLGLNPAQALQHPGFYYYMAARCTERRRERFLAALDAEAKQQVTMTAPGFSNEKKVEHLAIILELYTRAYELFKAYSPATVQGQGRLTLWIAYRIAHTYYESGKFDMAVRFFERIAKTYRREQWDSLLQPLLSTWYSCARKMGDVELSVRLLIEMLGHDITTQSDDPDSTQEDMLAVLKDHCQSSVPSTTEETLVVDSSDSQPILNSSIIFWQPNAIVGEAAAFQISLMARENVSLSALPFSSATIHFSADIPPIVVEQISADSMEDIPLVQEVNLGHVGQTADDVESKRIPASFRWRPRGTVVFVGTVSADMPAVIKVTKVVLRIAEGVWRIDLPLQTSHSRHPDIGYPSWLSSLDPVKFVPIRRDHYTSMTVHYKPHRVSVSLSHHAPAYVGEQYPIAINVTNMDEREMDMIVDTLLQPTDVDEPEDFISIGDERSASLIKGVSLGVIGPGVSTTVTLYLTSAGSVYDRVIDISVQSRVTSSTAEPTSPASPKSITAPSLIDRDETLCTLSIPVVEPIATEQRVIYKSTLAPRPGLADLRTYDHDFWDDGDAGEAVVTTVWRCIAPSGIVVERIKMVKQDGQHAKVVDCSVDQDFEEYLTDWMPGDEFCDHCRLSIAAGNHEIRSAGVKGPGEYEVSWRRLLPEGRHGSLSLTRFRLPALHPPSDELIALMDVPPSAKLHVPIQLRLIIRNQRPNRAANIVIHLEADSSDSFIVAGLRSGRIPILLPGTEEVVIWNLIPVECGFVQVPQIKVTDRRKNTDADMDDSGFHVAIVDVRHDERGGLGETEDYELADAAGRVHMTRYAEQPIVLVLP